MSNPTEGHSPLPWTGESHGAVWDAMALEVTRCAEYMDAELIVREVNEAPALRARVAELEQDNMSLRKETYKHRERVQELEAQVTEQAQELAQTQRDRDEAKLIYSRYRGHDRKWFEVAKARARDYRRTKAQRDELAARVKELEAAIKTALPQVLMWVPGPAGGTMSHTRVILERALADSKEATNE